MTAQDALQAAVNLLAQARKADDDGHGYTSGQLVAEANAWAQVAIAIEAGVPAPVYPDSWPAAFDSTS